MLLSRMGEQHAAFDQARSASIAALVVEQTKLQNLFTYAKVNAYLVKTSNYLPRILHALALDWQAK